MPPSCTVCNCDGRWMTHGYRGSRPTRYGSWGLLRSQEIELRRQVYVTTVYATVALISSRALLAPPSLHELLYLHWLDVWKRLVHVRALIAEAVSAQILQHHLPIEIIGRVRDSGVDALLKLFFREVTDCKFCPCGPKYLSKSCGHERRSRCLPLYFSSKATASL